MVNRKFISKIIPVLLTGMLLLTGVLPAQTATAAAAKPAGLPTSLNAGDWAQVKALLSANEDAAPESQQAYLKASNTDAMDNFGDAVSLSGDTLVVGAPGEASMYTGVNGGASAGG